MYARVCVGRHLCRHVCGHGGAYMTVPQEACRGLHDGTAGGFAILHYYELNDKNGVGSNACLPCVRAWLRRVHEWVKKRDGEGSRGPFGSKMKRVK